MNKNKYIKKFIIALVVYFLLQLLEGSIKLSYAITNNFSSIQLASFSSQLNMVISSFFSVAIVLMIYFVLYNFTNLFAPLIADNRVLQAIIFTVYFYSLCSIVKVIMHFVLLPALNLEAIPVQYLYTFLENSTWFHYITLCNFLMYICGNFIFMISLFNSEQNDFYGSCFATFCCYTLIICLLLFGL